MKGNRYQIWGTILKVLGIVMLIAYVILTYLFEHEATGFIGGGFGLIGAGISLSYAGKKKKRDTR